MGQFLKLSVACGCTVKITAVRTAVSPRRPHRVMPVILPPRLRRSFFFAEQEKSGECGFQPLCGIQNYEGSMPMILHLVALLVLGLMCGSELNVALFSH